MTWYLAAFLSAFFAALTAILAKVGVSKIDSNLATAIRTTIILVFTWGITYFQGTIKDVQKIDSKSFLFLVLSGIATGLSWLFYFYALKVGEVNKVVSIDKLSLVLTIIFAALILKEKVSVQVIAGVVMMTIGAIVIAIAK